MKAQSWLNLQEWLNWLLQPILVNFLNLSLHLQKNPLEVESNEAWETPRKEWSWAINSKSSLMQEVHTSCQQTPFWHEGHRIIIKELFYSFCNYWGMIWWRSWLLVVDDPLALNHLSIYLVMLIINNSKHRHLDRKLWIVVNHIIYVLPYLIFLVTTQIGILYIPLINIIIRCEDH